MKSAGVKFEAIKSGASGYLLKSLNAQEFFELLSGLERGEAPLSKRMAARVLQEFTRQNNETPTPTQADATRRLTARQKEILTLVAQGLTYKEAGAALSLSAHTVKYHMGQVLEQLHLDNRAEAIAYAARVGLVGARENTEPA